MSMGAVVVQDQVQCYCSWKFGIQAPQEFQKLLVAVPRITLANDPSLDDMQCGKQGGGAIAFVVVRERAAAARFEGQSWLGAIQRLNLTFLIHTKHHRILWRGQIDAHNIGEFLQKFGIA